MGTDVTTPLPLWISYPVGIGFLLLLFCFAYWWWCKERKKMEQFAGDQGLEFFEEVDCGVSLPGTFDIYKLGPIGTDPDVWVSFEQEEAQGRIAVAILYYMGEDRGSPARKGYPVTLAWVSDSTLALPLFHLRPEKWHDKIMMAANKKDIDFEDSVTFSKRYLLQGKDEPEIRKRFPRELRRFFEYRKGLFCEGDGDVLILYRKAKMLRLTKFRGREAAAVLKEMRELLELFQKTEAN